MVGYKPEEKQLSHYKYLLAGGTSGILTRACTQPVDFLKIRFQLQVEPIAKSGVDSKYRGVYHAVKTILKEESWTAFWKGHLPSQSLAGVFMAIEFAAFESLTKKLYTGHESQNQHTAQHFICGACAGSLATVASYPLDVLRTRFVTQGKVQVYSSITHAFNHIYRYEGMRGFYRGLLAGLCHIAPQSALYFGMYHVFGNTFTVFLPSHYSDLITALSGAAAGISSKFVVYPFDTSKRRLQVIGFETARKEFGATRIYTGVIDHLVTATKEEGFRGLYKGASWACIKAGLSTSMYFFIYEKVCSILRTSY